MMHAVLTAHDLPSACNTFHLFNRQGDSAPVLLDSAGKKIGPIAIDHVAETAVDLRKKCSFNNSRFILEGQKLHGFSALRVHYFAGNQPGGHPNPLSDKIRQMNRLNRSTI